MITGETQEDRLLLIATNRCCRFHFVYLLLSQLKCNTAAIYLSSKESFSFFLFSKLRHLFFS